MKTAKYESSPGALLALLNARPVAFVYCDLYTFQLASGPTLRYSTGDLDVSYGGNVWTHGAPPFDKKDQKAVGHWKVGLDVDTWQFGVMPRVVDPISGAAFPDKIVNQPWLAAVRGGAIKGAVVTVDRAFFPSWPNPAPVAASPTGVVTIFAGRVAATDVTRTAAYVTLNSHLELLQTNMPRNIWQAGCRHTLFDAGCTLVKASFAVAGAVNPGSTQNVILSTVQPQAGTSGTFALGQLVMTSGANAGFSRTVRGWTSGTFTLIAPFYFPVSVGDGFTVYPGCDKQFATCGLWSNTDNFGGQDLIPTPETAL